MVRYIFLGTFLISGVVMGARLLRDPILDGPLWADQSMYVQDGDPHEFNATETNGHPGGTVIEGTLLAYDTTPFLYLGSVNLFVSIFSALIIAGICGLCYLLRRNLLWCAAVLGVLTLDPLYSQSTPPSTIASLLGVFLCLFTLYIYENKERINISHMVFWGATAGAMIATRFDSGGIVTATLFLLLATRIDFKRLFIAGVTTCVAFVAFDPIMWMIPVQHIKGLLFNIINHYSPPPGTEMARYSFMDVLDFSSFAYIGVFLGAVFAVFYKKIPSPLPPRYTFFLIGMSALIYAILATAYLQAVRYFIPVIFIWEVFLPLFLIALIAHVRFSFIKTERGQGKMQLYLQSLVILIILFHPLMMTLRDLFNIV